MLKLYDKWYWYGAEITTNCWCFTRIARQVSSGEAFLSKRHRARLWARELGKMHAPGK